MTNRKTRTDYRSRRLEALHKAGAALRRVGALDKATKRDLDEFCLTKVKSLSGERAIAQVIGTRERVLTGSRSHECQG